MTTCSDFAYIRAGFLQMLSLTSIAEMTINIFVWNYKA